MHSHPSSLQVVANAVLALTEIQSLSDDPTVFVLDSTTLNRLLVALGECTEWGRIAILNAIAQYQNTEEADPAEREKELELICERVIPQFQHANGSVVLAAIKVRRFVPSTCRSLDVYAFAEHPVDRSS